MGKKKWMIIIGVFVLIAIIVVIGLQFFVNKDEERKAEIDYFDKHYAFITSLDDKGEMWEAAYEGAKQYGLEHDAYVEWFGKNLVEEYSKNELVEMAIAAKVDGIIVQGENSSEMDKLVGKATNAGIPLIAMWTDCYGSSRTSFVGMSSYNLGVEYCNYILKDTTSEDKSILVLINTSNNFSGEKLVFAGLKETLYGVSTDRFDVKTLIVDDYGTYSIEESIRKLLLSEDAQADIIVCLDENTTNILSRLVVDYNKVGESKIIGFYSSKATVEAVKSGVVEASLTIDGESLGRDCVIALETYFDSGFVSESIPVEIFTISQDNMEEWADE